MQKSSVTLKIRKTIFFLVLLVSVLEICAQSYKLSSSNKKAIKYYKQAENYYRGMEYENAEYTLIKSLQKDDRFLEAMLLLGDTYRDWYKTSKAIEVYEMVIKTDSVFFPPTYYFLGDLYLEEEQFDKAIENYRAYLKIEGSETDKVLIAKFGYDKAVFRKEAMQNPVVEIISKLDTTINSVQKEYINYVNENEDYLVFTIKDSGPLGLLSSSIEEYFMESKKVDGIWQKPTVLEIPASGRFDKGGMNLSFDGKQMYFTGCNWPGGMGRCDIYTSHLRSGKWQKPTQMPKGINSTSWDSQASISADGRKMYFTSRRKGGKGGSDIWMSIKIDGHWTMAINLGDSINSSGDEMAPFIHADGKTLYYSSDGTIGMGAYDLLISRRLPTGEWTKGRNLGYPINTKDNDLNIFVAIDGKKAWVSSDRSRGNGWFDIFSFEMPDAIKSNKIITLKGIVLDSATNKVLESTIEITNLQSSELSSISISDAEDGEFLSVLFPNREYAINISCKGYFFYSGTMNISRNESSNIQKTFKLIKIQKGASASLQNIYFDTDKWEIKGESLPELNKLVELLKQNPDLNILIEGHTDNSGSENHNQLLSEKRAKAVMEFLILKDIKPNRLSFVGFGAEKPITDNSTEKGKSLNRRTVVRVL